MTQDNLLDPKEDDAINPSHYKSHPSGVECIEISKHLSGCLAQAFQYVWRCGHKDDPIQELDKAIWFIRAELTVDNYQPLVYADVVEKLGLVLSSEIDYNRIIALTNIVIANKTPIDLRSNRLGIAISAIEELKAVYVRCGV